MKVQESLVQYLSLCFLFKTQEEQWVKEYITIDGCIERN